MNFKASEAIEELEYNATRSQLIIPEYGRFIQSMIDQAIEIEDREKRNKTARYIISVMGTLNPHLRDVPDFQHKLWDQIFIMSKFKLEVDSPYPIPTEEIVHLKPELLNYPQNHPKYRFYGNNLKYMIEVANSWEEGELKEALIFAIANHMKKCYLNWNKETVTDEVIFDHLFELSNGKINLHKSDEELTKSNDLIRINNKNKTSQNNQKNQNNLKNNNQKNQNNTNNNQKNQNNLKNNNQKNQNNNKNNQNNRNKAQQNVKA